MAERESDSPGLFRPGRRVGGRLDASVSPQGNADHFQGMQTVTQRGTGPTRTGGERESVHTVVVVSGGADLDLVAVEAVAGADRVVAADGGLDHALAAGLRPDVLVGDLDSVSAAGLDWATANIAIERHPVDKVATDTELALSCAAAMRPRRVTLVAGGGDRLDHAIAAIGALGQEALGGIEIVTGWWGARSRWIVHPARRSRYWRSTGRVAV
jgi:hypothetical protein